MTKEDLYVPPDSVGDVTSDEKGSGARYNGGKPDLSLIPLEILGSYLEEFGQAGANDSVAHAMELLGGFQAHRTVSSLYGLLQTLGDDGWEECAHVFTYGKKKYAAWNWAKGMDWSIPIACAARHLMAMWAGQELDPESGLPHRGHVFCNAVMLLHYVRTYAEGDDLPAAGVL